ncbi:DUF892 family protein [Pedobacter africanus]|uniref:Ferritin-like metal-binding protein YciE n=1 Tax=Pedobacter africanus TaxID=151894 RepID=A0A1W2CW91_9SPHI|nr:DUF892 family protein [Pedobacter africanus]SMC88978.1 Ferritin-like metal-binding protein YciE [Pedobacter africanus]
MKPVNTDLQGLYLQQLTRLLESEKKYAKSFEKLAPLSYTEELRSALVSASTELQQHIERIEQCQQLLKSKESAQISAIDKCLLDILKQIKSTTKSSLLKDINILQICQHIFTAKVTVYQNLKLMAEVLKQDHAALLLGQSANDNQNNYAYLVQISGNIIYPQTAGIES